MHDRDKNILEKYNILCVTVTVLKKKRLLLSFYICKEKRDTDSCSLRSANRGFRKESELIKYVSLYPKGVDSGKEGR